jgi:peptide/nickel transport system substrate-binding protein
MSKFARNLSMLIVLVLFGVALAACGSTETPVVPEEPVVEDPVVEEPVIEEPEEPVVEEPEEPVVEETVVKTERKGGWLDEWIFTVADPAAALTQIKAGDIDIYAEGLQPAMAQEVKDSGLAYKTSQGTYFGVFFNPAEFADGSFNPFGNRKIREAFNWLTDRNYFAQEIFAGGGKAKWFAITTEWPDYADLADKVRELESYYAYDPDKAAEVITAEMEGMGAELVDGKWTYEGEPVVLKFLIRDDAARTAMGNWTSDKLEEIGFTVDRQYKSGSEASAIWIGTDPTEGQWHMYTAGWGASVINRSQANIFQEMYLPTSQQGISAFFFNEAEPEFQTLGDDLYNAKYNTLEERHDMMSRALELSLQDSLHMWWIDSTEFTPYRTDLMPVADLAAGTQNRVAPFTLRYEGVEGGTVRWAQQDLFAEPYNPVAGTNWTFDQAVISATKADDVLYDPYTGLLHPVRLERSEVTMLEGLPVGKSLDWVDLDFADEIVVPDDAWYDWDATTQKFITVEEAGMSGLTAKRKSISYYPADLFDTVQWHDGGKFSVADMLFSFILTFDRAKEESPIYDPQAVPTYQVFRDSFKGFKILSTDPLTVEVYRDDYSEDAELNVATFWPSWQSGELSFVNGATSYLAEEAGELALSSDKSASEEVEQTSYIGGPSLEILEKYLDQMIEEEYIPYEATIGEYITKEEAVARYEALKAFYADKGHFWVGTGAYYIDQVNMTEKSLVAKNNFNYVDFADRWDMFATPKIADAEIDGTGQVKLGEESAFDVYVTFDGDAYPANEVKGVKFLLYNAEGVLVEVGEAELVEDGQYIVTLTPEMLEKIGAGSAKIEVAVVLIPVSQPTFTTLEFVVVE